MSFDKRLFKKLHTIETYITSLPIEYLQKKFPLEKKGIMVEYSTVLFIWLITGIVLNLQNSLLSVLLIKTSLVAASFMQLLFLEVGFLAFCFTKFTKQKKDKLIYFLICFLANIVAVSFLASVGWLTMDNLMLIIE